MKYRPDIDGLRTIAVLAVFLFHLGFSRFIGGFLGVDVFFVLSGFLITSIIYNDISNNSFSFSDFYARRIRRIMPPLVFTVLGTILLIVLIQPWPEWQIGFWNSLRWVFGYIPNFFFHGTLSDYWASSANTMPMLHTWSLGVEEQFYLIFPPLILILCRFFKTRLKYILFALAVISFIAMIFANKSDAFYLPWYRAWELLFGAILAVHLYDKKTVSRPKIAIILSILGFAAIIASVLFLGGKSFTGAMGIIPVIGTALVIYAGAAGPIGWLLSRKPMVHIGKLSYSIYLWHWPLIVGARWMLIDLSIPVCIAILILAYLLSLISYKLIETPFRRKVFLGTTKRLFIATAIITVLFICISKPMAKLTRKIYPNFITYDLLLKTDFSGFNKNKKVLFFGNEKKTDYDLLIFGDSHAFTSSLMYQNLCEKHDAKCAIFWGGGDSIFTKKFDEKNMRELKNFLAKNKIKNILITSAWFAINGQSASNYLTYMTDEFQKNNPNVRQWVQLPTPRFKYLVPEGMFKGKTQIISKTGFYNQYHFGETIKMLRARGDYKVIDVLAYICDEKNCFSEFDGNAIYSDTDHYTKYGAELFSPAVEKIFK